VYRDGDGDGGVVCQGVSAVWGPVELLTCGIWDWILGVLGWGGMEMADRLDWKTGCVL
jgi:hypothetical protein